MTENDLKRLSGDLTHDRVSRLYRESLGLRGTQWPEQIDLAEVGHCDSSAVALLLEWLSVARASGRSVRFVNPPEGLRTIAHLSQADTLLGWDAPA